MANEQKPTDDKIDELLARVQRQKDAIAGLERPVYKTNLTFSYVDGDPNRTHNLHTVNNVATLLKMAAHVRAQEREYREVAASLLDADKTPPFLWAGHSAADWLHDFEILIKRCWLKAERDKLSAMETVLQKLMSPERRAAQALAEIEAQLGG